MGSVVTVAELMRRCAAAPEVDDEGATPIPVSALLRREGRSAAGLPVVDTSAGEILSTLPARQPLLRRGAIAAGALLAAGSVFGLTAAMNAPVPPPTSNGTYPDQGDPAAPGSSGALDAGVAAPSSWLPVAFPTLFPASEAPAPKAAPALPARQAAAPAPAANRAATRQASTPVPSTARNSTPPTEKKDTRVVGGTVDTVGDTVKEVGDQTPLKPVTDGLGDTVSEVGRQVDTITEPVTQPLTGTVKRVVDSSPTKVVSGLLG